MYLLGEGDEIYTPEINDDICSILTETNWLTSRVYRLNYYFIYY